MNVDVSMVRADKKTRNRHREGVHRDVILRQLRCNVHVSS